MISATVVLNSTMLLVSRVASWSQENRQFYIKNNVDLIFYVYKQFCHSYAGGTSKHLLAKTLENSFIFSYIYFKLDSWLPFWV